MNYYPLKQTHCSWDAELLHYKANGNYVGLSRAGEGLAIAVSIHAGIWWINFFGLEVDRCDWPIKIIGDD